MQQPSPSSCAGPDDFDLVFPLDLCFFPELDGDDDGFATEHAACMDQLPQAVAAETQVGEEKLVMGYDGRRFEFDSVQPHKVRAEEELAVRSHLVGSIIPTIWTLLNNPNIKTMYAGGNHPVAATRTGTCSSGRKRQTTVSHLSGTLHYPAHCSWNSTER
jgi:hypothetical protein